MKKIFVGTVEIAGFFGNLSSGLRDNGYTVTEAYFTDHVFKYTNGPDKFPALFKIARDYRSKFYNRPQGEKLPRLFYFLIFQLSLHLFFIQALLKYQVFIFGFGISIFANDKDLKWLKRFGKTVISVVALGSEARPPYIDGARRGRDGKWVPTNELIELSLKMKEKIVGIEKHSTVVVGAPLTSQFLEKPFVNLFQLGLPYPKSKTQIVEKGKIGINSKIKILHSPSNPYAKGTFKIREVIDSLKKKGYDFQFIELFNSPNHVVLEAIASCDLVVDQVYSDTAMATFATEAAFFGKPAIVGGYGWDELKKCIDQDKFPLTFICKPEDLEAAIERMISNPLEREDLGNRANKFVNDLWEAKKVGEKFSFLIEGNTPKDWFLDPQLIVYTHGVGLSESELIELVKDVVRLGGEKALLLDNKPLLKTAFLNLISQKNS
jgi:hypothetical protein